MDDCTVATRTPYQPPIRRAHLLAVLLLATSMHAPGALTEPLKSITAVQREGQGNEAASAAWKSVVAAGPAALPEILAAVGTGTVVADNWLRLAGDVIVENAIASGKPLPLREMEAFLRDTKNSGPARKLAFDLIRQADSPKADLLEP